MRHFAYDTSARQRTSTYTDVYVWHCLPKVSLAGP